METQKDNIMISKFKGPISKHCRICNQKKLLSKFHLDETTIDKHSIICKVCNTLFLYLWLSLWYCSEHIRIMEWNYLLIMIVPTMGPCQCESFLILSLSCPFFMNSII